MKEELKKIVTDALEALESVTSIFEEVSIKTEAVKAIEAIENTAFSVDLPINERVATHRMLHDAIDSLYFPLGEVAREFLA